MVRMILTAIVIVLLAVFVAFNLKFTSSISLYGAQFNDVPVMAIALVGFALGVVYSLFMSLGRYLHARRKKSLQDREKELSRREQQAAPGEAASERSSPARPEGLSDDQDQASAGSAPAVSSPVRRGFLGRARRRGP